MPVLHVCTINAVSAKPPMQLNGLSAKCTTLPLVLRLPKILMSYARLHILQSLVHLLLRQFTVLIFHHVAIVILTPPTMSTTINTPPNIAAIHSAACAVALAVAIAMMIIIATPDHPTHTLTATMWTVVIFCLLNVIALILWGMNPLLLKTLPLCPCHIPTDLIILSGTPIQTKTLTIPFILTAMKIGKTPLPQHMNQMINIMLQAKNLTLGTNPRKTCPLHLTFATTPNLRPKNTATGTTPSLTNSSSWVSFLSCHLFLSNRTKFLEYENSQKTLDPHDNNQ